MKTIHEILADYGIAVAQESREEFERQLFSSYKTVAEMEKKDAKLAQLEEELSQKDQLHAQELADRDFSGMLQSSIASFKGRNPKAITALLDMEALKTAEDPQKATQDALEKLRSTDGYLFEIRNTPPLYARGTGADSGAQKRAPATLAGALQERFNKERK